MRMIAKCLVTTSLVLVTAAAAAPAFAADVNASSAIDAVTVYPDGASITRVIALDLPSGDSTLVAKDFPLTLDPSSLRVEGEGAAKLTIGSIDARPPRAVPPVNLSEIDKRIEALKDERGNLQGAIDAANARRKFAERFAETSPAGMGEKGEARPISEWRAAFAAVSEEIATADAAIREATRKQRDIDREISRLEAERSAKPPSKLEVRIDVASAAATKATLRVTYNVRSARWLPLYDARLDTGTKDRKPQLELVRRAEITQSTGEDWSNVSLGVSTVRVSRGGSAPELNSLVVRYPQIPKPLALGTASDSAMPAPPMARQAQSAAMAKDKAAEPELRERADEQQANAEIGDFQAVYQINGRVSLGANEGAKSLLISSMTVTPDLAIRAAPVVDPTAYLEASFKLAEDTNLLPGKVAIYRDGTFVGRSKFSVAARNDAIRLGFGADDKIKIERTVVRQNEGTAGVIASSKTDARSFRTVVRNGHDFPIRIAIEDQLPVSENEDIGVEMLSSTTPPTTTNLRDKRGVLEWAFEAKPAEVKEIKFGWRIRWPKDKGIVMTPAG